MARWKLLSNHYLMTNPPVQWESKETDRNTGRQARKVFDVPRYLDTKDPSDHNYDGDIVVCDGNNPQPKDIIFLGDPSSEMEPIDDEARKITQKFKDSGVWVIKEQGLDHGETLIKKFMDKMDKLELQPVPTNGIDPKAFAEMQNQMKALTEQNVKLQAKLLEKRP